jgi:hypothetical protein
MSTDMIIGRVTMSTPPAYPGIQELLEHIEPPKKVAVATGCPLCEKIWSSAMAYENLGLDKVAIVMNYGEPWLFVPSVPGDNPWHQKTVMRVNYCPKCGRRLIEE